MGLGLGQQKSLGWGVQATRRTCSCRRRRCHHPAAPLLLPPGALQRAGRCATAGASRGALLAKASRGGCNCERHCVSCSERAQAADNKRWNVVHDVGIARRLTSRALGLRISFRVAAGRSMPPADGRPINGLIMRTGQGSQAACLCTCTRPCQSQQCSPALVVKAGQG